MSKEKDYTLVLDGQQRMTIFNLVFKGIFEDTYRKKTRIKNLYFNLLTDLEKENEMGENFYEFKFFENIKGEYFSDSNKIWFRIKDMLYLKSIVDKKYELVEKFNLDRLSEKLIEKNLESLKNSINEDNISFYEIEKSKKDEEALEIFVRVNSEGVVLSYSDLLFSKIIQYWKDNNDDENARDIFYKFLNGDERRGELKGINRISEGYKFDNDFILKTSLVLTGAEIRYKIKNFDKDCIKKIKDNWIKITDSIRKVVEYLPRIGISSHKYLRSLNALIPIIYFVYKNNLHNVDIDEYTNENKQFYEKYLYTVLLNGVFGGQTDQLLKNSRDIINNSTGIYPLNDLFKSYESLNKKIRQKEDLYDLIDEIKYNTDKSKIILKILYGGFMDEKAQEDHIFPQTPLKKKFENKRVDNICNLQVLKSSNQKKNDKSFDIWLKDILLKNPNYLEDNFIPKLDVYSENNFENFLELRKEIIYKKLVHYFT